jgi:hypothetical protein
VTTVLERLAQGAGSMSSARLGTRADWGAMISGRVGAPSFPGAPLTEPDLWASHPALRDAGVRELNPVVQRRHCCPQLSRHDGRGRDVAGVIFPPPVGQ